MGVEEHEGKIITFYSFKGGVGRTMALANVAFLAAMNGKRVLAMDWDLEAPGLSYYFRSLLPLPDARALGNSKGILNILWDWRNSQQIIAENPEKEQEVLTNLQNGTLFEACVIKFVESELDPLGSSLELGGSLDYIGSGSKSVNTPNESSYEDALARFPWHDFFEHEAGGLVIDNFRRWAKSKYDLVLIDSRTGMADVAGICTMQIPDSVALCFVMNHQNIDGVSKVAGAIRVNRGDSLSVRAVPMRVSRQDTPSEVDARALAIRTLTRIGGFPLDSLNEDIRLNSVLLADNVPFYETLAPLIATDPALDSLTLNYLRLANQITGMTFEVPILDSNLIESVRSRLRPRHATVEYVKNLLHVEPNRALHELERLIEAAHDAEIEGEEQNNSYIVSLVEATFGVGKQADDEFAAFVLENKVLDMLRELYVRAPAKWASILSMAIEEYVASNYFLEPEEELDLLEELDKLLLLLQTIVAKFKRIYFRRRAARLFVLLKNSEAAVQTVGEFLISVGELRQTNTVISSDQADELLVADVEANFIRGDVYVLQENFNKAIEAFLTGLTQIAAAEQTSSKFDWNRLKFNLHSRLADVNNSLGNHLVASDHVMAASIIGVSLGSTAVRKFSEFAEIVFFVSESPETALTFCETWFGSEQNFSEQLASYYGRQPQLTDDFLRIIEKLISTLRKLEDGRAPAMISTLADYAVLTVRNLSRRRQTFNAQTTKKLFTQINVISEALKQAKVQHQKLDEIVESGGLFKRIAIKNI
jgi:AAA domain